MDEHEFDRKLYLVLLLPVLLLVLLAVALAWQIGATLSQQQRVDHSDRITSRLNQMERLIIDEETGLRGFQLTHDPRLLQPYSEAEQPLHESFLALEKLLAGDAEQTRTLATVRQMHGSWMQFAAHVLAVTRAGQDTRAPELNLQGKQQMDALRNQVFILTAREETRRTQLVAQSSHQVRLLMLSLALACGGLSLILGLGVLRNLRFVSRAFHTALQQANQRAADLHESRQWLQTTLDSIGDALIACDAQGCVDIMNPVAQQLTGWSLEEARGRPLPEVLHLVNQSTRLPVENPVTQVLARNAAVELANHTILIAKGGEEVVIDDSAAPIRHSNGDIAGVVMVFRDVTDNRRKEAALLASEKLAVAGRLAASIAHEIHNPLDSVANLHYLIEHANDEEERDRYLSLAQQELTRTLQISRTMLSLYRDTREPVSVDLRDLIEGVLLLLDRRLKDQSIAVELDLSSEARVEGLPGELRQVLTNLIANAADAAGKRGRIHIAVAPSTPADGAPGWVIAVSDNGPGIAEEIRERLFHPFVTTKGENGTGLGLWVSRGIISKHGGTLELLSGAGLSPSHDGPARDGGAQHSLAQVHHRTPGAVARIYLPARSALRAATEPQVFNLGQGDPSHGDPSHGDLSRGRGTAAANSLQID